jgi:hypothetical protein
MVKESEKYKKMMIGYKKELDKARENQEVGKWCGYLLAYRTCELLYNSFVKSEINI